MGTQVKKPKAYSYIRLSTALQRKGHGRQRQLEKSVAYAAANNLELVSDPLEDIGISAYKGKNVTEGVLGQFIALAEAGRIEPGSFLLVESLDRLSRQEAQKSLALFLRILEAGITIVTLGEGDKRTYKPNDVNTNDLIMTLMIMGRAHEESQTKADRIRANWARKRASAQVHPMTAMCPAWLQLSRDRKSYREIEKRVETVQWIFNEAASGLGVYAIARRLNEQKVPHFGKSNGWHMSYVVKILKNRAVLGKFQPHKVVNDKRHPDGDPIENYFPAIVSEETFYRVQHGMAERRTAGAGRKGKDYANLFSGLLSCSHCNGSVKFENKGTGPKGGQYLVCDNARRGLGCQALRWRYDHFEISALFFLKDQVDLNKILHGPNDNDRLFLLDNQIEGLRGKRKDLEDNRDRTFGLLHTMTDATEYVREKLVGYERELRALDVEIDRACKERDLLLAEADAITKGQDIRELIDTLRAEQTDRYKIRTQLAAKLRALIQNIEVNFALPEEYIRAMPEREAQLRKEIEKELRKLESQGVDISIYLAIDKHPPTKYTAEEMEELVEAAAQSTFKVTFKTGQIETAAPAKEDALDPSILSNRELMAKLASLGFDVSDPIKAMRAYVDSQLNGEKDKDTLPAK